MNETLTKPMCMTAVAVPVTGAGIWAWLTAAASQATPVVAFLSACVGLLVGLLSLVWWMRRLKK